VRLRWPQRGVDATTIFRQKLRTLLATLQDIFNEPIDSGIGHLVVVTGVFLNVRDCRIVSSVYSALYSQARPSTFPRLRELLVAETGPAFYSAILLVGTVIYLKGARS
jgi:hypothetical protein